MNGLILLDKPAGLSSFAALGEVKRRLKTRKIGHTGTLDPFATGLMVVLVGAFTRLAGQITDMDKAYDAVIRLGSTTDTLDRDGTVVDTCPLPRSEDLIAAIPRFVGPISQQPPIFSAIRVGGRRAYQIARGGEIPQIPTRNVEVFSCLLHSYEPPLARLSVHCSKGTYIRSLARDIAREAGSCAYVEQLRRTAVGPFSVANAVHADRFDPAQHLLGAREAMKALPGASSVMVADAAIPRLQHGGRLSPADIIGDTSNEGIYGLFDRDDTLLALADYAAGEFRYRCVLSRPSEVRVDTDSSTGDN